MDDRLIHPMFTKSSRSAAYGGRAAAIAVLLFAASLVLAQLLTSFESVGPGAPQQQPIHPSSGLGL